jgi:hypothetical protein
MGRLDEIDPAACRQSVVDKFSEDVMAAGYLERYEQAIALSKKPAGKAKRTKK